MAAGESRYSRRGPHLETFPAAGEDQQNRSVAVSGLWQQVKTGGAGIRWLASGAARGEQGEHRAGQCWHLQSPGRELSLRSGLLSLEQLVLTSESGKREDRSSQPGSCVHEPPLPRCWEGKSQMFRTRNGQKEGWPVGSSSPPQRRLHLSDPRK